MLISYDSSKSLEQLEADLTAACAEHRFGVLGRHDIRAKLAEKGQNYGRDCLVLEVCNPAAAREVLETNPAISTALPCRISVFQTKKGTTRIATIKPTLLLDMFGSPELEHVAEEVERALDAIMRQAAG